MKKCLLLGASENQLISVVRAKKLGYYTITVDNIPSNPGHKIADQSFNVSTTDIESIFQLSKNLNIDGIVCFASDPAAPTAAKVSELLNLNSNPSYSVDILSNKFKFRKFLKDNNFNTPMFIKGSSLITFVDSWDKFSKPVIIKPVDSSGSKGVTKIDSIDELEQAVKLALSFSRSKTVIMEEFINVKHQLNAEFFSYKGKLIFSCIGDQYFDHQAKNPFVPISTCYPSILSQNLKIKINNTVQSLLSKLTMQTCAYNCELKIDQDENIYIIDIGARCGGNKIPQVVEYATNFQYINNIIKGAMGDLTPCLEYKFNKGFYTYFVLHSNKEGILQNIKIAEDINNNILNIDITKNEGDFINAFSASNDSIGTVLLQFDDLEQYLYFLKNNKEIFKIEVK